MNTKYLRNLCFALVALAMVSSPLRAADAAATKLAVGDKAPAFEGKDQDGKTWKLADFNGKKAVLLYFYPKDNTPGCTKEACGFRDNIGDLKKEGVEVVGVSYDSSDSHQKFIEKFNLNFTLLADTDGKITALYGAKMSEKPMARRISFLIDKDGRIVHITDVPSADTHLAEMKDAVKKLKAGWRAGLCGRSNLSKLATGRLCWFS